MINTTHTDTSQSIFRALADPTRRGILMHLSQHEMTIAEVASHFEITRAAIQKHLVILEEGALISVRKKGRERINRLEPQSLKQVSDWLAYFDQFWDNKLANLQQIINQDMER